jgi:hypothetical protein
MASDLFMWAIYDWDLTFHKAFQGRIAKAARKSKYMLNIFLLQASS